jgi:hypothetical protein
VEIVNGLAEVAHLFWRDFLESLVSLVGQQRSQTIVVLNGKCDGIFLGKFRGILFAVWTFLLERHCGDMPT